MDRLILAAALAIVPALAANPAAADEKLAKEKGCTACHDIAKKLIGPPYAEVAKKYKGDKDAAARLAEHVIKGSKGVWGPIPMPPNKVTEEEAKKLAAWVLSR